ncbi:MAG: SusC/RagA family TonB-linked outer membrane protein [Tannerellaceae bacterium]|jgi:TonB-linked SusC/RagA family outer membrane protein|nr:SusC/RagA family TonB-linked outer membrane protein [Tannerellaceae bacterium]
MKKLTYLLLCLFLGIGLVTAQTTQVTGTVISADDGEPIIGASIIVKGTTTGTVTDFDGNFSLSVPSSSGTLVVSYVGMVSQEVAVQPAVYIRLQSDTQRLDEVVVTALGISKERKALGYAVQDVKANELTKAGNTSLAGALQGKVSGIQISSSSGMPGASSRITIRGVRSFTGENTPLYVVDGMPIASTPNRGTGNSVSDADYANRAMDIDPNDIESINILKGQAASALYGMRASNGVIVITTKSGKGAKKGKPQVFITSNVSFDKPSTYMEYQKEYAQGSGGKYNPTSSLTWGPKISELANDPVYGGNTDNKYTQQYGKKEGQYYVLQRERAGLDGWAIPQAYDNIKDFFETGVTWSNNINVMQGFDKGHYSFSLGNTTQSGIVPSTGLDRYNARLNGEAKLHENWTTGFTGNFVTSKLNKQTGANNGIVAFLYGSPSSYDLAGIPNHMEGDPYTQNTYRPIGGLPGSYWATEHNKWIERNSRFFGNTYINYSTKLNTTDHKLDIKYQLGVDSYTTTYSNIYGYGHADGQGEINDYNYVVTDVNQLLTAAYVWNINEDWSFDMLVGNEFTQKRQKYDHIYAKNFNFPGWDHINNATTYSSKEDLTRRRTVGSFYQASVSYANMLYLSTTGRHDVVSYMPRNNRSYFYPSVSLGWIFTELEPVKNKILTYGKIRASYAQVGQGEDYYQTYYSTPTYGGGFYNGEPIKYPIGGVSSFTQYNTVYDPNLKPQNTQSYEFGADLTFLDGLFSLNYTFSRQDVKDQIFSVPLARSTGSSSLVTNGGSVHTNAHEVTLAINPINTKNFKWDMAFNFSKIDNYVDELAEGVESIFLGGFVDPQVRYNIENKAPVIYGTRFLRNDKGDIVVDDNGLPEHGSEGVIGNIAPDFNLGFNTTFEIFKFRIGATFDWKQGGQIYHGTYNVANYYGTTQRSADFRNMESFLFEKPAVKVTARDDKGNPTAYAPNDIRITGDHAYDYFNRLNNISEGGIFDNSFIKLRELSVSYPVWSKNGIDVNVNAFARNIILWSELKGGFDPESTQGNNNMAGGFERFSLPGTSSYGFGVNVKF